MTVDRRHGFRSGTTIVIKASGGDYAISTASLANSTSESTGARQSVKIDFGEFRRPMALYADIEFAATPTNANNVGHWISPSLSATAGTGNAGNASGTDAAYTGYSNNITASLDQCTFIGLMKTTVQATSTVQRNVFCGVYVPIQRYGSLIVWNRSGAAFHSDATNICWTFVPVEGISEPQP